MPYGAHTPSGKPPEPEVARILTRAASAGLSLLDTAPSYGTSEEVLGRCLPDPAAFRIVTKTPVFKAASAPFSAIDVESTFRQSLHKLAQRRLYGLLVHHAEDLLAATGPRLWETLEHLKSQGLVEKIGVSVYRPQQIEDVLKTYKIDLIQVPVNVLDQRLLQRGLLSGLKRRNVEVHGRSVFLQGVLLMPLDRLPPHLDKAKTLLEEYHRFAKEQGLTPVQAAVRFALEQPELDSVLVGANSLAELNQILQEPEAAPRGPLDWSRFACKQEALIDPSRWPATGGRG
jgi:aryl-alcohol dehydrogenase-like predicted oxidoreductase